MNIPQSLVDLLNKADPGFTVFAHMLPTRIFRISASDDFLRFRVEQLTRTNKDNLNAQGSWRTISAHSGDRPGEALDVTVKAAIDTQGNFIKKMQARMGAKVDAEIKRRGMVPK